MKMPLSVKSLFYWFVFLAAASCLPLAFFVFQLIIEVRRPSIGESVSLLVLLLLFAAMFGSFVFAICRGPRRWITIPYAVTGLFVAFMFVFVCRGSWAIPIGITVALATIVPLVVLYSSRATAWFDSLGPRNGTNWGLVCFMLVVLGGFVLPSFTIARPINADTCAQAMRGRNLFVMQAENRQSHESDTSVPLVDLSSCSSSEEYVRGLFAANGDNDTNELARSVRQWTFVVNVPEDAPNTFPVIFSANFDPSVLPREWDGKAEADKILKIMPIEGVEPLKFGDKAVVVVRKGGVSQVIRKEYCRLDVLFCRQPYRFAENTYFLSPVGKIDTKGSK